MIKTLVEEIRNLYEEEIKNGTEYEEWLIDLVKEGTPEEWMEYNEDCYEAEITDLTFEEYLHEVIDEKLYIF